MHDSIEKLCQQFESQTDLISEERKLILESIAQAIKHDIDLSNKAELVFICTHNSRRSHMGQIWTSALAQYYGLSKIISAYSGGTEVTAFHPNTISALETLGFKMETMAHGSNPIYDVKYGKSQSTRCFSKLFDDNENPESGFLAIMTCSHADENCPFISGANYRFSTPYEDPKIFDGTKLQNDKYIERAMDIGREIAYMFSVLSLKEDNA
ncbi:hypothetical protein [Psychroflexus tropicus]|uniref:arsenate reductase/protein-tyrosine-phosphatase family protein n=1 Tax=Psychroflexus tropicus TaxID=197345 RepID=UPI000364A71E|nr:hypothetical protein [Psychroflexus tropicus]